MEWKGTLPYSQEPATRPYPELPLPLGLRSGLFPSGFQTKILHAFLVSLCATRPANLHTRDSITIIISGEI
jgi:hypothetical protein